VLVRKAVVDVQTSVREIFEDQFCLDRHAQSGPDLLMVLYGLILHD